MEPLDKTATPPRWNGLKTRVISGVLLAAVVLAALVAGGWLFTLLVTLAGLLMLREWDALTNGNGTAWQVGGLFYAGLPCASLIWLRGLHIAANISDSSGLYLVLYVLLAVWATDIGAYFTGRRIGGPKLAPAISPGKTWAGLGGGMLAAAVAGAVCSVFTPYPFTTVSCALLAVLLAVVAQAGDLFESWLKRRVGAKDSGTLIPGHGGILDRVDGLVFTVPLFAVLVALSGLAG